MKFLDSIKEGVAKATAADRHIIEVNELFRELNDELASFEEGGVRLDRKASVQSAISEISSIFTEGNVDKEFLKGDRLFLTDGEGRRNFSEVARWRQHVNGYPCMLNFEGQEYICGSIDDLKAALQDLLSSAGFGKALHSALRQVKNSPKI